MRIFADKNGYRVVLAHSEMSLGCINASDKLNQLSESLAEWGISFAAWDKDLQKTLFCVPAGFDYSDVRKARLRDRSLVGLLGKLAQFKPTPSAGNSWGDGFASVSR
jgi:hypothetical protein